MTRQALWLPWQRPCWLAVSPRLVLHCLLSTGWPFSSHSYQCHGTTSATRSHYLHYELRSVSEFLLILTTLSWVLRTIMYDTCELSRQTEVNRFIKQWRRNCNVLWKWLGSYFFRAVARPGLLLSLLFLGSPFSSLCLNASVSTRKKSGVRCECDVPSWLA